MFRFIIAAAAIALSTGHAVANGHGGGDAAPAPKPEATTAPAKVVLTKQGPKLVDLKGMTLYYYERDTSGKTSNCNGKCTESWVPLAAPADAKAIGDFTVISRNDGSKMWAYRYRPLYTSPADKTPGEVNGNATTLQWRIARPED
ncbi:MULTISPECIES: COG4315 family predicted lipoprotein [unclassified Bradyrhizobium]